MSPNQPASVLESPEDVVTEQQPDVQTPEDGSVDPAPETVNGAPANGEPIDLTDTAASDAKPVEGPDEVVPPDVVKASVDVGQKSRAGHMMIDDALRQAGDILLKGQAQADEVVEKAQTRALVVLGEAEDAAAARLAEARAEAARIEAGAEQAAAEAVAEARKEYKIKATEITNQAIADSRLLVSNAEDQAQEIFQRSRSKAERMISASVATIEQKEQHAKERVAALTVLVDTRMAQAQGEASAIIEKARASVVKTQERAVADGHELRREAQAEADRIVTDAQTKADEIVESVEELKATAHARLAAAVNEAAARGAASARQKIEAQLIDTRREIQDLNAQIMARRAELAELENA